MTNEDDNQKDAKPGALWFPPNLVDDHNVPMRTQPGTGVIFTVFEPGSYTVKKEDLIRINGLGKILTDLEIACAQQGALLGLDMTVSVETNAITGDVTFSWGPLP